MDDIKKRLDEIFLKITINDKNPFERDFDESVFDLANDLIRAHEESDYVETIIELSNNIDAHKIGCLFDILLWSTRDEGQKVQEWRKKSLENGKEREVEIALCVSNAYPMIDLHRFLSVLDELTIKYPKLASLYEHWKSSTQNSIKRDEKEEKPGRIFGWLRNLLRRDLKEKLRGR